MILYHGSPMIVQKPELKKGKKYNDYGQGFYCTKNIEMAKEWACTINNDGYSNEYQFDTLDLSILNLQDTKYNILNWLAILMENRKVDFSNALAIEGSKYIIENFLPDYKKYDVIIGYRADDCYFSFVKAFISNTISLSQLSYIMKLGELGEQIVLKTDKAFERIKFVNAEFESRKDYYSKRKARSDKAKLDFSNAFKNPDLNGIFMRDILKEGMKNDDPRLF